MNGFKAYRYYLALRLHFTTESYNVFKSNGNIKVSLNTFKSRNDHYLFEKLARKYPSDKELIQYIVANFAYGNSNLLYDESISQSNYTQWIKIKESITKTFTDDLHSAMLEAEKVGINEIINCTLNDLPYIMKLYLGKVVQPHTISILHDLTNMIDEYQSNANMLMLLHDDLICLKKLKGFFSYDSEKLKKIYTEICINKNG